MELTLTTPGLLFPTVSLLLLAFTNRFLALAALIRNMYAQYKTQPDPVLLPQIRNLQLRLRLIRDMQFLGVSSLFLCVVCMLLLFAGMRQAGEYVFVGSLLLMLGSLALSIREIQISIRALQIQLGDLEREERTR
ncbi:DUF2721 domain-containing protein [Vitiosangium sp. GDMCC 1.1324]|uniref:DUF2721 domain-containing protein n=1 Tax=Vitiosangium sp. (strain GDMCC 1.1324) TaxID=2138576 RepID=UPI000D3C7A7E|nr:DUF2721 domain-containing protein [Vitiosangium sp. GDMCC 1.1324]PTL85512.1 DUF2721 domain-containing protein [Vitiosangium sp. GDMCC 1.1324]